MVSWELESFAVTCDLGRVSLLHFPFPQIPFSTELLREETSGSAQQIVDRSTYLLLSVYLQYVAQECQTQPAEPVEVEVYAAAPTGKGRPVAT